MHDLTAVLLCGGKGERLRPYTDRVPKPLVPLKGRPLLYHLLRYLGAWGIRRFVLCVGYKAELIEGFAAEMRAPDREIVCVNSGEASMTDRLLDARPHIHGPALVCYGDTLANVDLGTLRQQHQRSGAGATLSVYPLRSPFGIVNFQDGGRVTGFVEKPLLPHWINIGFLLCEPEALARLRRGSDMVAYLDSLVAAGALGAYRHEGKHLTINTEKDRTQAELDIVEFYTVMSEPSE
jgi:glucose-1-phosphate cytidylyltransferase